jgi:uncharacterized protein (DUF433 family)
VQDHHRPGVHRLRRLRARRRGPLLDYLEGGETIDQFLEGFPSASREQVIAFLEAASRQIIAAAS